MTDYQSILRMIFDGRSYEEITAAVGCSRRDVSRAKKTITEKGLTRDSAAGLSAGEVAELFPDGRRRSGTGFIAPDFASVVEAMKANRHYTRQQAWHRYISAHGEGVRYSYSQFCQLFSVHRPLDLVPLLVGHRTALRRRTSCECMAGGWRARVLAATLFPELLYDMFLNLVYINGVIDITLGSKAAWGNTTAETLSLSRRRTDEPKVSHDA